MVGIADVHGVAAAHGGARPAHRPAEQAGEQGGAGSGVGDGDVHARMQSSRAGPSNVARTPGNPNPQVEVKSCFFRRWEPPPNWSNSRRNPSWRGNTTETVGQAMDGRDGAVQDQIEDTVKDAVVAGAASPSAAEREGASIATIAWRGHPAPRRREAIPGVAPCVACLPAVMGRQCLFIRRSTARCATASCARDA